MSKAQVDAEPWWIWSKQRLYDAWFDAEQIKRMRGG